MKPFKAYFPIAVKLADLNFISLFWIILFAFPLYLGFSLQSLKTYIRVLIILLYQSYKARANFNNISLQLDSSKKNPVDNVCLKCSNTEPNKENVYYCKVSEKLTTLGLMKAGLFPLWDWRNEMLKANILWYLWHQDRWTGTVGGKSVPGNHLCTRVVSHFIFSDKVPYVFTNFAHISLQICLHILIHLKSLFADDSSGSSLGLFLLTIFSPIYGSYFLFLIDLTAAIWV